MLQADRLVDDDFAGDAIALEFLFPDNAPVEVLEHVECTSRILGYQHGAKKLFNDNIMQIVGRGARNEGVG